MPKIGPNKVSIDPKAYAARVTRAKQVVARMDPATKAKLNEYYPKVTKESIAKQALGVKKTTPEQKRMQSNMSKTATRKPVAPRTPSKGTKTPMPKISGTKPGVKKPMPKVTTKPRIVQMPNKISPSKMTPAQKAKYLQNPERYDK